MAQEMVGSDLVAKVVFYSGIVAETIVLTGTATYLTWKNSDKLKSYLFPFLEYIKNFKEINQRGKKRSYDWGIGGTFSMLMEERHVPENIDGGYTEDIPEEPPWDGRKNLDDKIGY